MPKLFYKKYLKKQLNQIHVYPDSESTRLRSNLKWFTGINTSQILIGNGATEIIYNFCNAFLSKKQMKRLSHLDIRLN